MKLRPIFSFAGSTPPAWGAASQSCALVSLPADAAVQQQPQPVVGEVAEAVADAPALLDEQVDGLGRSVRAAICGVEGEDLGLPARTVRQPGQLRNLDAIAPAVEAVQVGGTELFAVSVRLSSRCNGASTSS
jgi:hypothetical protein